MEQEPILNEHNLAESESKANPICFAEPKQGHELNAHNKQEYPPMHTGGLNTPQRIKILVLMFGLFVLCGCGHKGTADIASSDSIVCSIVYDEQQDDSLSCEIQLPPEPEWKCGLKNKYRELTDSETKDLSFGGYDNKYGIIFDRWQDFVNDYRPYYSKLTCPKCGHRFLVIYSESPQEYWEGLCGRGGYFFICTQCKRIDDFECTVMN